MRHLRKRCHALRLTVLPLLVALFSGVLLTPLAGAAPPSQIPQPEFADPAFQRTWERYDRPVYYGDASRSYTWGASITKGLQEPYKEGANGQHLVQYFEKSRMEINDPNADQNNPFFVTQGLLARDMIRGEIQEGQNTFRKVTPARIPFGDPDDQTGPTYASFNGVLNAPPVPSGQPITATIDRAGNVSNSADSRGVTSMGVVPGTTTNHSIASVFYSYLTQSGVVYENGQNVTAALYNPFFYVMGMPITEAYWTTVKANNAPRVVLIQCFERRCLTYAPSNPQNFQVEQANTGLQYYNWRYPKTPADTTAPVLSNLKTSNITATSVTITWTTDEPSTSEVRYGSNGRTDTYDVFQGDMTPVTEHSVTLYGLKPDTNYHFVISSVDASGNRATSGDNVFKTMAQTSPPTISNVKVTPSQNSATITFTTDQAATVQVIYWTDPTKKTVVSTTDAASTTHTVTLSNLAAGTTYTFQIIASSASGQTTTNAATFSTTGTAP